MAGEDPFYVRDTIGQLRERPEEGPLAPRLAKLRIVKAQIEESMPGESLESAGQGRPWPPLLRAVNEAIDRIRAGVYHLCAKCGRRIRESRVRTESPWITLCDDCRGKAAKS